MADLLNQFTLDFEKPVRELEEQIQELEDSAKNRPEINLGKEIKALNKKVETLTKEIYSNLSPWERVQLSRHPQRPHAVDFIEKMVTDFEEIHGDRSFGDDKTIITGFGYLEKNKSKQKVCVVAIEKGRKTKEKVTHNFGMPNPEGYRKAIRAMKLASRFNVPIITLIDTPGAFPGIGAEERGQASAIAENLAEMFDLNTPIVASVIGEGGSGGALGIAIADSVLMLEYSIYSVISPESCASILWADPKRSEQAANALKLDPNNALELKIIDKIVDEPSGGAHKDYDKAALLLKEQILKSLNDLKGLSADELKENRYSKFREIGNNTLTKVNELKGSSQND